MDKLRAELDDLIAGAHGKDTAANSGCGFQHRDGVACLDKSTRSREAGHAGTNYKDVARFSCHA
jgi:hypothetical protein